MHKYNLGFMFLSISLLLSILAYFETGEIGRLTMGIILLSMAIAVLLFLSATVDYAVFTDRKENTEQQKELIQKEISFQLRRKK